MNAVVRIQVSAGPSVHVTPSEVLEDFADATSMWYYEEEDSRHYGTTRGTEAVVLQTFDPALGLVDFAFACDDAAPGGSLALRLVLDHQAHQPIDTSDRRRLTDRLLTDFSSYLRDRPDLVRILSVEEGFESLA